MRDLLALDSWRQFVRVYLRAGGRRARDVRAWLLTILNSLPMLDQVEMCLVLFEECEAYQSPHSLNDGIDLLAQTSEGLLDSLGPWTRARDGYKLYLTGSTAERLIEAYWPGCIV